VGHSFGPTSREVTDTLLRADRALAALFAELDQRVGRGRWLAALSADHGVLDLPEALVVRGMGAVRVPAARVQAAHDAMRAALREAYGQDFWLATDEASVRLSERAMRDAGLDPASVRRLAADALQQAGADWIETVIPADELLGAEPPAGAWLIPWWHCHDPERSPDLRVQQRPWHILSGFDDLGTTHGTPYEYDRRVPLVFLGPGFAPGASFALASPCDAVPTLLAALALPIPTDLDGRQLP
jgi:arylsulfatase A-like enzyme